MLVPDEMEKAIILACKGHHKCKTTLEALKEVVAEHCGLKIEDVRLYTVYYWINKVYLKFVSIGFQEEMLDKLFGTSGMVSMEEMVDRMSYYIEFIKVRDVKNGIVLIDLGRD